MLCWLFPPTEGPAQHGSATAPVALAEPPRQPGQDSPRGFMCQHPAGLETVRLQGWLLCCRGTSQTPCTEAAIPPPIPCGWRRCLSSAGLEALHHQFCLFISALQPQEAAALHFQVSHREHAPLWVGHRHVEHGHCCRGDMGTWEYSLSWVGHRHCFSWDMGTWDVGTTAGETLARAHCFFSNCTDLQDQKFSSRIPKSKSPHFPAVVKSFLYLSEQYPSEIKSPGPSSPTAEFM